MQRERRKAAAAPRDRPVGGRRRGSEESEEALPQVDELIDAKQFATTMGDMGIGGVIARGELN